MPRLHVLKYNTYYFMIILNYIRTQVCLQLTVTQFVHSALWGRLCRNSSFCYFILFFLFKSGKKLRGMMTTSDAISYNDTEIVHNSQKITKLHINVSHEKNR